jgi:RNA polymerase sigma-70 factor, ECF subfamily
VVTATDDALAREFAEHRRHLLGVAYRLTSTLADAEDAVQEAWLRLAAQPPEARAAIRDLRAWLTTVVGRICLDRLRSATARHEHYVGPWLPEPLVTELPGALPVGRAPDPLDEVVRTEDVRLAALVVLDRLTPEQRVAFVLHDAVSLPFTEIAEVLGCTVPAARQHASRGRKALADADPPPRTELAAQQEVIGAFLAALANGDVDGLVAVLHPDVVVVGDGGGKARTARRTVNGADKVARFALGLFERYGPSLAAARFVLVNGDFGLLLPEAPEVDPHNFAGRRVTTFAVRDDKIVAVYDIVNPDKLHRVDFTGPS